MRPQRTWLAAVPPRQCRRISAGDGARGPHCYPWVRVPMRIAGAPDIVIGCLRNAVEFGDLVDRDREAISRHEGPHRRVASGRRDRRRDTLLRAATRRGTPPAENIPLFPQLDDTRNSYREFRVTESR